VLAEALVNAGRMLGMNQTDLGRVIGKDRSAISRGQIDPQSKAGELALLLIRIYRSLFVLVGGEADAMQHWMHTENRHTGGVPAKQVTTIQGLMQVLEVPRRNARPHLMDIWREAEGERHIQPIAGTLLRMVESQEQIATNRLVDALDKQQLLEELLEGTKPDYRPGTRHLHYLLATPFRYPPLRHGSRFGRRSEPALFYDVHCRCRPCWRNPPITASCSGMA
jgi:hypothetical protein